MALPAQGIFLAAGAALGGQRMERLEAVGALAMLETQTKTATPELLTPEVAAVVVATTTNQAAQAALA